MKTAREILDENVCEYSYINKYVINHVISAMEKYADQFKNNKSKIPNDAYDLEVFAIKDSEDSPTGKQAFIGFKINNGNFNFISVPYSEPLDGDKIDILNKTYKRLVNDKPTNPDYYTNLKTK